MLLEELKINSWLLLVLIYIWYWCYPSYEHTHFILTIRTGLPVFALRTVPQIYWRIITTITSFWTCNWHFPQYIYLANTSNLANFANQKCTCFLSYPLQCKLCLEIYYVKINILELLVSMTHRFMICFIMLCV